MNLEKTVVDGELWYIDNFLTEEEIALFKEHTDDKNGWYTTMRSPYKNVLNKFIGAKMNMDENGNVSKILTDEPYEVPEWFSVIHERIQSVVPGVYQPHTTLQTFKYVSREDLPGSLATRFDGIDPNEIDFAMQWHDENARMNPGLIVSFSIYLNDNFSGGSLKFKKNNYVIDPKPGRFVNIPVTPEFEHMVEFVEGNDRHTFYGNSYTDKSYWRYSAPENC
jgi:hypothetical protein